MMSKSTSIRHDHREVIENAIMGQDRTQQKRIGPSEIGTPTCVHGIMKYWESSKTGTVLYFCSLDKNHPDVCEAVKG